MEKYYIGVKHYETSICCIDKSIGKYVYLYSISGLVYKLWCSATRLCATDRIRADIIIIIIENNYCKWNLVNQNKTHLRAYIALPQTFINVPIRCCYSTVYVGYVLKRCFYFKESTSKLL